MVDHIVDASGPRGRVEIRNGIGRRRRWSDEEKGRIVAESFAPGAVVSEVARRHEMSPQHLFAWRKTARDGQLALPADGAAMFVPVMMIPSGAVRVLMATRPVDFRKGMDGLAALARESLGSDPYSGVIYVFRAKRADRVKLLLWDGTGLVLVSKRLEQGAFRWPAINDGVMRLTSSQLAALL